MLQPQEAVQSENFKQVHTNRFDTFCIQMFPINLMDGPVMITIEKMHYVPPSHCYTFNEWVGPNAYFILN